MKPNVAGQEISAIILDASGNEVTTGTTTVSVNKDGTPGTGGTASYSNGEWRFTPIQSDTDGVKVNFKFSNAGGPPALVQIFTSVPQSVDNATGIAAIPAAVWAVSTRTLTSFGTLVADIWDNVNRTLTDKTGFSILGTKNVLDDLNDLSAAEITALFAGFLDSGVLVSGITIVDDDPIEVTRGDTKLVTITLGTQWPLTDKLVYFIIKKNQTDANSTAIVNRLTNIIDAPNGIAQILLTSEEMAVVDCYHYEVELRRDPEDDQPETPKQGKWKINQDTRQ